MFPIVLSSKKARLALRFFTYGVMTLATVLLTVLAIFYAMGYRFNQSTLTFEQGGLLQLRSAPPGAAVTINSRLQSFTTPGRVNLPSGVHAVTMQRDGYREWQKTVSLAPGQLLWLNYIRLIPNSVTTQPLKEFGVVTTMLTSPDHRWILLQEKPEQTTFTLVDVGNERQPQYTTLSLPEDRLTRVNDKLGRLTVTEWELGSRYFLVRHQNDTIDEWIRVDRAQPQNAVNITSLFGLALTSVHFTGSNPNIVYAKTDGVLRRFDIGASSASAALVHNVQQFTLYGNDSLAFTAEREVVGGNGTSKQQVVGMYTRDKEIMVETFPAGTALKIAYAEYTNHAYLAIHQGEGEVRIVRDPITASGGATSTEFAAMHVGRAVDQLQFSNNGRMLTARAGNTITTYDIELGVIYSNTLAFMNEQTTRPLKWLDDYYLWTDAGDRLRIVEFDGQNEREITAVAMGLGASLSQSGETMFSVGKNSLTGSYSFQASPLIVR